ncbi:MAG: acyl CoA:acetate/3-ketoacid CoA transferase [Gammaproteobacteria bacterium]
MNAKIIAFDDAAKRIPNGATLTVSGSSGLACPDKMLAAIGARFAASGEPHGLTLIHPIAAGDMYGIKGIDHLAQTGLIQRVVAGSYPSGPSALPSPTIWQMIIADAIEAYNLPSGVLFDMHREVAARRPGVLTKVGLDTFVDPRRLGGKMNAKTREDLVRVVEFNGEEWLHYRNLAPDVAIIRATTADENGNLSMEHEGAYLGVLDQALAAHNNGGIVIAQVKRVTAAGTIPSQRVYVPSTLVDYVVVDPDQKQATETPYDPAISGEVRRPLSDFAPVAWNSDKIIARRAALELRRGDAINLGFGISALVPGILLEEGLAGAVTWAIEQGPVGGIPLTGFVFGCAANAEAIMPSPQQFTYFQGGGFDCSLLSFMEVDSEGSVNVSRLGAKPHVTAGCGGFIDIVAHAKKLVFSGYFSAGGLELNIDDGRLKIIKEGRFPKLVPQVEHVTFSGRRGRALKQDVTYITERCVLKLLPAGLTVVEVAPGVELERDILRQVKIDLRVSESLRTMDARLFAPAPLALRLSEPN